LEQGDKAILEQETINQVTSLVVDASLNSRGGVQGSFHTPLGRTQGPPTTLGWVPSKYLVVSIIYYPNTIQYTKYVLTPNSIPLSVTHLTVLSHSHYL